MNYEVTAVGDDWVEIWDGESFIDKSNVSGRDKSVDRVFVGIMHPFQVGDQVGLKVYLIARITHPDDTEPTNLSTITTPESIDPKPRRFPPLSPVES